MPRHPTSPQVLAHVRMADGVAFQLRKDPPGTLEVSELNNVLLSIHVGSPTRVSCRRNNRHFTGTAVHGDIDIIPAHTPSRWVMHDENDTALLLSLPQQFLHRIANESGVDSSKLEIRNRFQVRDRELEALSWAMKREMESGCPSGRFYLDGLALAVASRLVTRHSSLAKSAPEKNQGLSGHKLKRILSFIEDQLAENLSLDQIATVAGVSASHMNTLFRKSTGLPIHQYVIQRRVERAKTLLTQDNLSMEEIAQTVGFAHQSHMAKHMRRVLGVPPKAMKRLLAESPNYN
ncbi:helix-turn-helix domain-containing protein [Tunturiibacter gelidoferens]|uniref:AraC family transcriptional regulator n=1 Tax=Tunturiibacter lichenicola TaxID=2051959 RepID=A0A7Y9NIV7_9BACT|nr:AraC family transcriptional regulator [Edaphobacter lichenicola]NYF50206.1 AraC family transcriptional regulator [Edaphobacter lichenicola]